MITEEKLEQFHRNVCQNCKNKGTDLCEIRISIINNIVQTKCAFYERDKK